MASSLPGLTALILLAEMEKYDSCPCLIPLVKFQIHGSQKEEQIPSRIIKITWFPVALLPDMTGIIHIHNNVNQRNSRQSTGSWFVQGTVRNMEGRIRAMVRRSSHLLSTCTSPRWYQTLFTNTILFTSHHDLSRYTIIFPFYRQANRGIESRG